MKSLILLLLTCIRQLNRLLHSNQLETMSRENLLTIIGNLGLKVQLPIIDRGVYAPQSGVKANTEGDFDECTVIPQIQAYNPRKLDLQQGGSSFCWNVVSLNSKIFNCRVESSSGGEITRPKTICTVDKDNVDVASSQPIDVESIEILSHRHLVLNLAPGPKRKSGIQVHYYYSDYQLVSTEFSRQTSVKQPFFALRHGLNQFYRV